MKKIITTLASILFSMMAHSAFIPANDNFYSSVYGNGLEKGVTFTFQVSAKKVGEEIVANEVKLSVKSDSAECGNKVQVVNEPESSDYQYTNAQGEQVFTNTYKVVVPIKVGGDTGGCVVTVNEVASEKLLKIVNYNYVTK